MADDTILRLSQEAVAMERFGPLPGEPGDICSARKDFASAIELNKGPLKSLVAAEYALHQLNLGNLAAARTLCDQGLEIARINNWNYNFPWFNSLLARIDLAEGKDPELHLAEARAWSSRTGEMRSSIEANLLTSRYLLASGDPQAALNEAETGFLHAVSCGHGLLRIELLVVMSRIHLTWPEAPKTIQAAREALDLAAHPDCQYAWGEADAAQAWGEAYFSNHEPTLARRAFTRALEVRKRIEHPGVAETERWLALVE